MTDDDPPRIDDAEARAMLSASEAAIAGGRRDDAARALATLAGHAPTEWTRVRVGADGFQHIAFWSLAEFVDYAGAHRDQRVAWDGLPWGKVFYLQAVLALDAGDAETALGHVTRGRAFEPDHAMLRCEEALVRARLGELDAAMVLYSGVLADFEAQPWIRDCAAIALRGFASCHLTRGALDEAEQLYQFSLELEPRSSVARHQLAVIAELRARR